MFIVLALGDIRLWVDTNLDLAQYCELFYYIFIRYFDIALTIILLWQHSITVYRPTQLSRVTLAYTSMHARFYPLDPTNNYIIDYLTTSTQLILQISTNVSDVIIRGYNPICTKNVQTTTVGDSISAALVAILLMHSS